MAKSYTLLSVSDYLCCLSYINFKSVGTELKSVVERSTILLCCLLLAIFLKSVRLSEEHQNQLALTARMETG